MAQLEFVRVKRSPVPIPAGETPGVLTRHQMSYVCSVSFQTHQYLHFCYGTQPLRKNKTWMRKAEANTSAFSPPRFDYFLTDNF